MGIFTQFIDYSNLGKKTSKLCKVIWHEKSGWYLVKVEKGK